MPSSRQLLWLVRVEHQEETAMENPDTADKRSSLKRGDRITVLQGSNNSSDINEDDKWTPATVVSTSAAAVTVKFADDGQEVIPWDSGRICTRDNK